MNYKSQQCTKVSKIDINRLYVGFYYLKGFDVFKITRHGFELVQ